MLVKVLHSQSFSLGTVYLGITGHLIAVSVF